MTWPSRFPSRLGIALHRAFCALFLASMAAAGLLADSTSRLRSVPAGSCYCGCTESGAKGGCVKMCELPRYASRWWATTCAKPHIRRPANDSNAGPHLRRPDRATYAQNSR
jgi:hypothetical protein